MSVSIRAVLFLFFTKFLLFLYHVILFSIALHFFLHSPILLLHHYLLLSHEQSTCLSFSEGASPFTIFSITLFVSFKSARAMIPPISSSLFFFVYSFFFFF